MKFHAPLLGLLRSKTKIKIVRFLLTHEALMSEREIASIVKISHMSVNRTMRELAHVNFVTFVTAGKSHLWQVNRKSYAFKAFSALLENLSAIKDPLKNIESTILSHTPCRLVKKIVMFGSISKGLERADSDIDVFFLLKTAGDKKKLEPYLEKLSDICFEKYGNRLAPYVLTEREMGSPNKAKLLLEIDNGMQIFPRKKG